MTHTSPLPDDPTMPYKDPRHPFEVSHGLVSYTFPLSTGQFAQLLLPQHVTVEDARRFQQFVFTVCVSSAVDAEARNGEE